MGLLLRGEKSDYKVVIGRSEKVMGPYLDKNGVAMTAEWRKFNRSGRWKRMVMAPVIIRPTILMVGIILSIMAMMRKTGAGPNLSFMSYSGQRRLACDRRMNQIKESRVSLDAVNRSLILRKKCGE